MSDRFNHAIRIMRAKGCKPFTPDGPSAVRSARWLPEDGSATLEAAALPIDAIIAAFAIGVLLGMLIP